jgi:hypothetical protein
MEQQYQYQWLTNTPPSAAKPLKTPHQKRLEIRSPSVKRANPNESRIRKDSHLHAK